jgi:hypothetical protein
VRPVDDAGWGTQVGPGDKPPGGDPWWRRRSVQVGAAAVVGLAIAAVVLVVVNPFSGGGGTNDDPPPDDAAKEEYIAKANEVCAELVPPPNQTAEDVLWNARERYVKLQALGEAPEDPALVDDALDDFDQGIQALEQGEIDTWNEMVASGIQKLNEYGITQCGGAS